MDAFPVKAIWIFHVYGSTAPAVTTGLSSTGEGNCIRVHLAQRFFQNFMGDLHPIKYP